MNIRHSFKEPNWSVRVDPCAPHFLFMLIIMMAAFCLVSGPAFAIEKEDLRATGDGKFCSRTAKVVFRACKNEVKDDSLITSAKCLNISDQTEREGCLTDAEDTLSEESQLCEDQLSARIDVCKLVGEDRYDPNFDPLLFDSNFSNLTNPNPYFPLTIGNTWEFQGENELNTLEILNETKLIEGVTCIVLRDLVLKNGDIVEFTDDWFAQAKNGTTWYCGDEVKDFESFDGDNPRRAELVSIDGSFKVGRDYDKPGIISLRTPAPGDVYREEFSLGNAEDLAEILTTTYSFGSNAELDQFVPQQLAEILCAGDCVVTRNFQPSEPGIFARKYYAPGIGYFLEVKPQTGEILQLTNCNFDARCTSLPTP